MDFVPFDPPPTDHDSLATGYTTEKGVNAKTFVEGINTYLAHLFAAVEGKTAPAIAKTEKDVQVAKVDLVKLFAGLSDRMAKLEEGHAMLEARLTSAPSTPQAALPLAVPDPSAPAMPPPNPQHVETASEAVQRIHNDLAAALAKAKAEVGTAVADVEGALPRNTLADVLAGISR